MPIVLESTVDSGKSTGLGVTDPAPLQVLTALMTLNTPLTLFDLSFLHWYNFYLLFTLLLLLVVFEITFHCIAKVVRELTM